MNLILYAVSFACLTLGLFFLLCEVCGAPTQRRAKAMQALLKPPITEEKDSYQQLVDFFAHPLANIFPFSNAQIEKYGKILESANITISPKLYLARSMVNAALLFLLTLASSVVVKPMFVVAFAVPVMVYWTELKKADKITASYRQSIEQELPDFVATIATQLTANRDIVRMMQEYSNTASPNFKKELQTTIADMQTGSYEEALKHFTARVHSSTLHSVVRGLIGVLRGNDEIAYFKMLGYELKQQELVNMKKTAQKCIPKISACAMILLMGMLVLFTGVLIIDMLSGIEVIF